MTHTNTGLALVSAAALASALALPAAVAQVGAEPALLGESAGLDVAVAPAWPASQAQLETRLTLIVDHNLVAGSRGPSGQVEVELRSAAGHLLAAGNTVARPDDAWSVRLVTPDRSPRGPLPGERLEVRTSGGHLAYTVPDVSLVMDRPAGAVHGRTRPGAEVTFGVASPERVATAIADDHGTFRLSLGSPLAGRAATTTTLAELGHTTTFLRPVPQVVASMHPGDVGGRARPLSPIAVVLFGPNGRVKATGRATAGDSGAYTTWLRRPDGEVLRPAAGDRVEVADIDQTLAVIVPAVTGAYDLAAGTVFGTGIPHSTIGLVVWNPYVEGDYLSTTVTANATGAWQLRPDEPIRPASHFYITQYLAAGDHIFYCEQIPALHISPGSPAITVETLWDVAAGIEVRRHGQVVAGAEGAGTAEGWLNLVVRDAAGRPVPVAPGDEVTGDFGDVRRSVLVTPLTATISATGTLHGVAMPGSNVFMTVGGRGTEADSAGRFEIDVSDTTENGWVAPGKQLSVAYLTPGGDHIRQVFPGPTIDVTLGESIISGAAMPATVLTLTHVTATGTRALTTAAGPDGVYRTQLGDSVGSGDRVNLAIGPISTALQIPALTLTLEPQERQLRGTAPASGLITVEAFTGVSLFPDRLHAFVEADGTWLVPLVGRGRGQGDLDLARVARWVLQFRDGPHTTRLYMAGLPAPGPRLFLPVARKAPAGAAR